MKTVAVIGCGFVGGTELENSTIALNYPLA